MTIIIISIIIGIALAAIGYYFFEKKPIKAKPADISRLIEISENALKMVPTYTGETALARANELEGPDFEIVKTESSYLFIIGGSDLIEYHDIEIYFKNCHFTTLPDRFHWANFRTPTEDEVLRFNATTYSLKENEKLFCIEAETTDSIETNIFYVVAETVKLIEGAVLHRLEENLKEGTRIAPWILKLHENESHEN